MDWEFQRWQASWHRLMAEKGRELLRMVKDLVEISLDLAEISLDPVDLHWIWLGSLVESGGLDFGRENLSFDPPWSDFEYEDPQSPNWIDFGSSVLGYPSGGLGLVGLLIPLIRGVHQTAQKKKKIAHKIA